MKVTSPEPMGHAELCEHLKAHKVRLGLRLKIECDDPAALTPEVRAALAEHKPMLAYRLSGVLAWAELETWEWGSDPGEKTPPF
jgi:hypothetical protein